MIPRPSPIDRLGVENLESRLNLSTVTLLATAPDALDRAAALGVTGLGVQVSTLAATQSKQVKSLASLPATIMVSSTARCNVDTCLRIVLKS